MYVTAIDDHDNTVIFQRKLDDDDILDPNIYAAEVADMYCADVDGTEYYVPSGLGDFTIELAEEPMTAVCWTARAYFLCPE